jgi:hypothetical protein
MVMAWFEPAAAKQLLARAGHGGHVVADLQPQAAQKFDGLPTVSVPGDVLLVQGIEN